MAPPTSATAHAAANERSANRRSEMTGSAACGAAPSMGWLIAFRAVQGAGAGGLMASMFALTGDLFEPRERARYQGYGALIFAVSAPAMQPASSVRSRSSSQP